MSNVHHFPSFEDQYKRKCAADNNESSTIFEIEQQLKDNGWQIIMYDQHLFEWSALVDYTKKTVRMLIPTAYHALILMKRVQQYQHKIVGQYDYRFVKSEESVEGHQFLLLSVHEKVIVND